LNAALVAGRAAVGFDEQRILLTGLISDGLEQHTFDRRAVRALPRDDFRLT